jgi:broad specificity phosphatase PhoE
MLTLVVARHAETTLNAELRYQGWGDAPLTLAGEEQAHVLGERLAPIIARGGVRCISSDLGRACATARIALPDLAVPTDVRLREIDFGAFAGLTHDECLERFGPAYRTWLQDSTISDVPDGETFAAFRSRVVGWLDDQPRDGVSIAVTHGGTASILLSHLLDIPFAAARRAGLAHGDAICFTIDAARPVPDPVWLSDEALGRGRERAYERLAADRVRELHP